MVRRNRLPKFDYLAHVNKKYTEHLIENLKQPFYECIKKICDEINGSNNMKLKTFQKEMKNIKEWDYNRIKKESKFVIQKANLKYISKLLDAVFISNFKLLTTCASRKKVVMENKIPDAGQFFHRCFYEIGKCFYLEPYLICDTKEKNGIRLRNITESLSLIEKSINKTINHFLPYSEIIDVYLTNVEDDSSSDESSEEDYDEEAEKILNSDEENNESDEEDEEDEEENGITNQENNNIENNNQMIMDNNIQNNIQQQNNIEQMNREITIEDDNQIFNNEEQKNIDLPFGLMDVPEVEKNDTQNNNPIQELPPKTINLLENDNQINKQPEQKPEQKPEQIQTDKPKSKIIFFDDADDQFGE